MKKVIAKMVHDGKTGFAEERVSVLAYGEIIFVGPWCN